MEQKLKSKKPTPPDSNYLIFSAINKYDEQNILTSIETDSHRGFISCGENNQYLEYLRSLYLTCTTLKSCIDTATDYTCGNGILMDGNDNPINPNGETLYSLANKLLKDYYTFGGFAINIVRNRIGGKSLYYIPFEQLRTDETNTKFYYSKDWTKTYGRVKTTEYPAFDPSSDAPNSIYYYNNNKGISTYPVSPWVTAVESAEIQRRINQFHLNSLANGFAGSYLITFNNGIPNQEQADEIETDLIEKFSGTENAGRIAVSFANDKEHAAELQKLEVDDFGTKYESLMTRSRNEILNAFRLNGKIIGINEDNIGFNTQEFNESFKLYNRTVIRPVQNMIIKSLNYITGADISVIPFTLEN